MGTHELYRTLSVLKLCDVYKYNYNLLKFIRFTINGKPKLFGEFYETHLCFLNYHTRNSRFNLPPIRLDLDRNFAVI